MMPAAPASELAFLVAGQFGTTPEMSAIAYLGVSASLIHDDIKIERKANDHYERAHVNFAGIAPIAGGKTPLTRPFVNEVRRLEEEDFIRNEKRLKIYAMQKAVYDKAHDENLKHWKHRLGKVGPDGEPAAGFNPLSPDAEDEILRALPQEPEKPLAKQYIVEDATKEGMRDVALGNPGGTLNFQDELAGWIAGFDKYTVHGKGNDQSFWLKTDDGGPATVNRAGKVIRIPNVGCCFVGTIQTSMMDVLTALREDGFLARMMPVYAGEVGEEQLTPLDSVVKQAFADLVDRLAALNPDEYKTPIKYRNAYETDSGEEGSFEIRRRMERAIEGLARMPTTSSALRAHLGKWRGKISRMALLFHVIECVSRTDASGTPGRIEPYISVETMQRVERFMMRFLLPNARRFYGELADATEEELDERSDVRWFAGHILAQGSDKVSLRDLRRARNLNKAHDNRIIAAMTALSQANWVSEPQRGERQDQTLWTVNRRIYELFAECAIYERRHRAEVKAILAKATKAMHAGGIK